MKNLFKIDAEKKEERKAKRKACINNFYSELKYGANFLYKNRLQFFMWASIYLVFALLSLFFTKWTVDSPANFPLVILNVFPRLISLLFLTLAAFITKYRKTLFSVGLTVWSIWMLLLSGVQYGVVILAGFIGFVLAAGFFRFEIIKGNTTTPHKVMSAVCIWFYLFAGLTMLIELIHRFDISAPLFNLHRPFATFVKNPDLFGLNFMVVFFLGLFIFILRKKRAAFTCYTCVWLVLSVASIIKYSNVYEPVMLLDIFQFVDGFNAFVKFYNVFTLIVIALLLVAFIGGIVFLFIKEKAIRVNACAYVMVLVMGVTMFGSFWGVRNMGYTKADGKFIKQNYFNFGFPFSFINYALSSGVEKPFGYSKEQIDDIVNKVNDEYVKFGEAKKAQNVIVVQLESFADPYLFQRKYPELEFERDPIPFLRSLSEAYSTGTVEVPVFGGQTVKSEFEFLSGISLGNLPEGYNPYVQYLNENRIDNLVRYFKGEGYTATAIHNYQGEYFTRHQVYQNLGFDTFVPYECMPGVEKIENKLWANDQRLVDELLATLDSTEGNDFIMSVTVQLHGNYPSLEKAEYPMEIKGIPEEDKEFEGQVAYYVSQLIEFDKALENLITALSEREESTYVLMYSDHLPKLFTKYDELSDLEKYTTNWFSWNNMEIKKSDDNLKLSELSTRLCNDLSIDGTFINRFHNVYSKKSKNEYQEAEEKIDYHLMYVDVNATDYDNPSYKIGLTPLTLSNIVKDVDFANNGRYIIYGNSISVNTSIYVNGRGYALVFVDRNTAYLESHELKEGDELILRITGERDASVFQESNKFIYSELAVPEQK